MATVGGASRLFECVWGGRWGGRLCRQANARALGRCARRLGMLHADIGTIVVAAAAAAVGCGCGSWHPRAVPLLHTAPRLELARETQVRRNWQSYLAFTLPPAAAAASAVRPPPPCCAWCPTGRGAEADELRPGRHEGGADALLGGAGWQPPHAHLKALDHERWRLGGGGGGGGSRLPPCARRVEGLLREILLQLLAVALLLALPPLLLRRRRGGGGLGAPTGRLALDTRSPSPHRRRRCTCGLQRACVAPVQRV
jgi:hypothetical protein